MQHPKHNRTWTDEIDPCTRRTNIPVQPSRLQWSDTVESAARRMFRPWNHSYCMCVCKKNNSTYIESNVIDIWQMIWPPHPATTHSDRRHWPHTNRTRQKDPCWNCFLKQCKYLRSISILNGCVCVCVWLISPYRGAMHTLNWLKWMGWCSDKQPDLFVVRLIG